MLRVGSEHMTAEGQAVQCTFCYVVALAARNHAYHMLTCPVCDVSRDAIAFRLESCAKAACTPAQQAARLSHFAQSVSQGYCSSAVMSEPVPACLIAGTGSTYQDRSSFAMRFKWPATDKSTLLSSNSTTKPPMSSESMTGLMRMFLLFVICCNCLAISYSCSCCKRAALRTVTI